MRSQPQRLLDSAPAEGDLLALAVHASAASDPSQADLAAWQARLLDAASETPSQAAAPLGVSIKRIAWIAGVIVLGGLGAYVALRQEAPVQPPPVRIQPLMAAPEAVHDPDPPAVIPSAPEAIDPPTPLARPSRPTKPRVEAQPTESRTELELLQDAEAVLRQDPVAALSLTDQHMQTYPAGILTQEREVIGVKALLGLGKRSEAEARAERFRAAYPKSPLLRRLSRMLAPVTKLGNEAPIETSTEAEVKP